ncbi:MAG: HEAT repeat domain-containing protein [Armatimonadota bacterium]
MTGDCRDERLQPNEVPAVIDRLRDEDPATRESAVRRLASACRPTDVVCALTKCLGDEAPNVRAAAAEALGDLGKPAAGAVGDLTELIDDPDERVRRVAERAVVRIRARWRVP